LRERKAHSCGFLRPIIPGVVEKFLECGDLARGFARIRCDHCKEDRLLAFSCKGRWPCPSCHQKGPALRGAAGREHPLSGAAPEFRVQHPQECSARTFRYDRDLLKDLCRVAHECLTEFLRTSLPEGVPGIVMADPRSVARRPLPRLRHRTGHGVLRHLTRPAAPECASRTLVKRPPALRRQLFRVAGAPRNPKKPVFDFRAHFCHSAPMETHASGFKLRTNAPKGLKRFPISQTPGQRP